MTDRVSLIVSRLYLEIWLLANIFSRATLACTPATTKLSRTWKDEKVGERKKIGQEEKRNLV